MRTTFQLAAELPDSGAAVAEEVFTGAAQMALRWLAPKCPEPMPESAWSLETFELGHPGLQQLQCVSVPEGRSWSVRLVEPSAPFNGRPAVAGRTWTTDLALYQSGGGVRFGVRLACASTSYAADEPIDLTRPRIVLDLARRFGLQEIRPLDGQPWILETEDDLRALHDLLADPRRTMPVVMLTRTNPGDLPGKVRDYLLEEKDLARRTQGFAHVVCMPCELGYTWTDMVGKVWSAFRGAVRTYQPGLDFENDSPFSHPRVLIDRAIAWQYNGVWGERALASFLVDRLKEQAATKRVDWGGCMFFAEARSLRASLDRERVRREIESQWSREGQAPAYREQIEAMKQAHDKELAALKSEIQAVAEERDEWFQTADEAESERDSVRRDNRNLQLQNDELRRAIEAKSGTSADAGTLIPDDYGEMPDWVQEHLTGRLCLHPRAVQGLKKARYEDVGLVYHCLLLLAREYRDMRLGHETAKRACEDRMRELSLELSGSIKKERAGEQGHTYYPQWRGERRFLKWHLTKGDDRDPRHCLRIYFFWDADDSQVVVGWLPSHLGIRTT